MAKAPETYGALSPEQAASAYIDPVPASVIDTQGNYIRSVGVTARAVNVTSRYGAELAARETVYDEMGPGSVKVSGGLIDVIYLAGLAKVAAMNKAEAAELSDTEFQADLEANGLAVEFPLAETNQVESSPYNDTDNDIDGELTDSVDSLEDDTSNSRTERVLLLSSPLGEVALPDVDMDAVASDQEGSIRAELADEIPSQVEVIGGLIISETTMLIGIPGQAENAVAEDAGLVGDEEAGPTGLQRVEYGELQDLATEVSVAILGILAATRTAETDNEAGDEDPLSRFESLTIEDMALMSLTAYGQRVEPDADYVLAA